MVVHFNVNRLEAKRAGQSMRSISRYLSGGRSNDVYRLLINDKQGDCFSLATAVSICRWYGGLNCIEYAREDTIQTLKHLLYLNEGVSACEVPPEALSSGITEQAKGV